MSNYTPTGNPPAQTRGASSPMRNEFTAIATAITSKGDVAGQTWSGAHDYSAATSFKVPAPVNGADAVTKTYADALAFSTALPAQTLGFLRSSGTAAGFTTTHTGYAQNEVKGADIASAATINLTTATGNLVHITGTTGITAITIPVGALRSVIFDSALTMTHSAGLSLPSGQPITTGAGDRADIRGDTAGAVVMNFTRANGTALIGGQYLKVSEQKSTGTSAGTSLATEQTRTLNTVEVNEIAGASLASNTVTLPAGTYEVWARAPSVSPGGTQLRVYNSSDSTYTVIGASQWVSTGTNAQIDSIATGKFTITAAKNFQLKHYISNGIALGLGTASSGSQIEVYAEAIFRKVA